jgi:hypothetical protein
MCVSSASFEGCQKRLVQGVALLSLVLVGCAAQRLPQDALRLSESSLETRSIQTRNFEAPSENEILAASVAVLQDMGYNLEEIEKPLGVLTASKLSDADSTSEKTGLILLDMLCFAGGSTDCTAFSGASDSQKITVTLVVLPSLSRKGEFVSRITLQRVVFDKQKRVKYMGVIDNQEIYQQIFEKLAKSIFLEVNEQ